MIFFRVSGVTIIITVQPTTTTTTTTRKPKTKFIFFSAFLSIHSMLKHGYKDGKSFFIFFPKKNEKIHLQYKKVENHYQHDLWCVNFTHILHIFFFFRFFSSFLHPTTIIMMKMILVCGACISMFQTSEQKKNVLLLWMIIIIRMMIIIHNHL